MIELIENAKRKRGWESLPEILETRVGDYARGEGVATLFLDQGPVTTQWRLGSDGACGLTVLRFPRN